MEQSQLYWRYRGNELGAGRSLEVWREQGVLWLLDMQVRLPIFHLATVAHG